MKMSEKMLKLDLILQFMNYIDHCLNEKNKKSNQINESELGGKVITKFAGLSAKTYSYLIDDGSEDK